MKLGMVGSIAIVLLVVTGCREDTVRRNRSNTPSAGAALATAPAAERLLQPEQAASSATSASTDSTVAPMIIRTGDASIQVDSLNQGMAAVRALAGRLRGYVANTSMQAGNEQGHSATLQLKIPAARFDEALAGLKPIGKLESTNVTAEDVGEEYVDVSARVANGRRLETRLLDLLATRTGKLSDVLEVETELSRVRGEIDSAEGRLR
jgi:hypothetical protein